MKQQEAEILASASAIAHSVIAATHNGDWELCLYGENYSSISPRGDYVEAARGGHRTWSSLDSVYRWIMSLQSPSKIKIEIDG